jgi:hypothetical protein
MTVLEQLKLENPSLALLPDDLIVEKLLDDYQGDLDPDTFREQLLTGSPNVIEKPVTVPTAAPTAGKRPIGVGSNPQDIGYGQAFTSGLKSMWQRTWGPGVNYLKGGVAGLFGDESTAQKYYEEAREQDQEILNRTGYVTFEQATKGPDAGIDTFVKFGLQQAGMSLPYTILGGVGGLAGKFALRQAIGKTAATMTGATSALTPQAASFNIARQVEQVERGELDEVNEGLAFATALPSAMLESALYPVLGKLFGPLSRTQFSNVISSATLGRVAKGSAAGAVTEAITEVGQQAIERYQAGLPIDSPDALNEYKEAAAGAAFVGGLFGGATTTAGEIARTVQPTPTDAPVTQPIEKAAEAPVETPKVKAGIIQPQQQKDRAKEEAAKEQAKPASFAVQQEGDKFVVKSQELDANNNVIKTNNQGVFNTEAEATAKQQEIQDQKNKLPEQTFFTADEIKQQDPTLGNIIDEVEIQGGKISPGTKQVYYRKDLALPEGDLTNVMNSGGTAGSVADGWYDRTSDLVYVSLADLGKVNETVAHENFHALQRVTDRVSPNLFTEQEQTALDTFLPGGTIDSITPNVQKALGNDVMNTLRERHADRNISNREMQAYAFGAYATLKNKNRLLSAPNPVIRAFKKLFDFIKSAGNIFKKNKINNVKDIFDKARLGDIGKRAKTQPDVDALRTKSLAQAEKAAAKGVVPTKFEYSVTDLKYGDRTVGTILPFLDARLGRKIFEDIYNNPDITKPRIKARFRQMVRPEQGAAVDAIVDIGTKERELIDEDKFIEFRIEGTNETVKIGSATSRRSAVPELKKDAEGKAELKFLETQIAKVYKKAPAETARPGTVEYALSRVNIREDIKSKKNIFGKKYNLKTSIDDGVKENLSKIAIALDKEHEAKYGVVNQTPRIVKGKIAEDDKKIFDDSVEAGYQELKYQLELGRDTKTSGVGWYNRAITETIQRVKNIVPKMKEGTVLEKKDKELQFKLFLALFSPQGGPVQNLDVATEVFKKYLDTGVAPEGRSIYTESPLFGVSHQSMLKSLKLVDYLIKKHGKKPGAFTEYMYSTKTYKQLGKEKLQSGFFVPAKNQKKQELDYSDLSGINKTSFNTDTGKQEETLLMPAFMFGEKVGNFFLNFNGIEGVTKDRWFSRHYYRQFGQVGISRNPKTGKPLKSETKIVKDISGKKVERTYPPGHDPVTKLRDTTKANDKQVSELYVAAIRDRAKADGILKGEDATKQNVQAILWYFEQGLYTDLGLKSVPVDYVQATDVLEKKIINDTKLKGESYGQFYNTAVIKGTAADVKTRGKKGKATLTKDKAEEAKTELELSVSTDTAVRDIDVNAFQKSGSDVTAFSPEEYLAAVETRGPLVGHCAACTYVVQKNFGGDIMKVLVSPTKGYNTKRESHYFNKLPDGTFIDLTGEQYGNKGITPPKDFIDRATVSPYQWGKFDPKQSKEENKATAGVVSINPKFIKFEEKFGKEKTTQNLDELTPELSISENKTLLNPPGTKVTADIAEDFEILENIGMSPMDDNIASDIQNYIDDSYSADIKKFGEPVNIPDTNIPLFLFGIQVDGTSVGFGFGVRLGDTAYIDNVMLYKESTTYLSPSAFRRIGTQLSKQLGVKNFAGTRVTGARKKATQEREESIIASGFDLDAVSAEFSVSNVESFYKDPMNYSEYSLSDNTPQTDNFFTEAKVSSETDNRVGKIPSNVGELLFKNRKLKEGTPVAVRLNLNTTIFHDEDTGKINKLKNKFANIKNEEGYKSSKEKIKYRNKRKKEIAIETGVSIGTLQTAHDKNTDGDALGYDKAIIVKDPTFDVNQKKRFQVVEKGEKTPMASVKGGIVQKKIDKPIEGKRLFFNPFQHHLFVDGSGNAVKSVKGEVIVFNSAAYTNDEIEYYSREQGETLEVATKDNDSKVLYKYETEAEKKADQPLETDTLSKEKLREFNLEFAASDEKFSEGTQRFLDRVNPKRSRKTVAAHWKDFVDNWGVKFQQGLSDQYISVKKFIGEEEYKALTMTYGSSGATEGALLYGVPFMDNDGAIDLKQNSLGTGLFTRFEKLGDKLEKFLAWVAANRARNLVNKGFESGLGNINDINTAIKELQKGNEKQFNESLKDLQEFNKAFLDIAVKSGYLDPASAKVWTEDSGYNFYIPFYRLLEDPDSNSGPRAAADIVNQPDYPRYRGADIPVNDLLQNIIRNYSFLTEASLKNAAGLKTLEKGVNMGVARRVPNRTKTSVFVRNKGKMQHYEVDNKLVLESITALNWNGWQNPAMNVMRNFKRYLTYGVTASPAFRIRNLIRDSIHSVAVGKLKYNPLQNIFEGGGGLLKSKKNQSELRAKMAFGGGSIHFGHIYGDDPNATQMLLDRAIDVNTVMKRDGWSAGARRAINAKLRGGLKWWEEVGSFSENVNRAALYKQLRNKGVSHFEAAYQARDLLNFSRHGANPAVRFLTQSIPFLNARIQGLDKLGRAMTKEQRGQLITVLGTYSLASIALYLAYKDDEDFKQREQWDRDTYHWFKIPGTEGVFRIPRPFEVGAIGVIFERMVEQIVDDDVHGQLLAERIGHAITETLAVDFRPQLITPALEVYSNKDSFTGRPIESMGMKRLPASERKYAYTSSAYIGASKVLELIPWEKVQLSPVQIEHLVQGYFGWVGSTVASAVSVVDYPRKGAEFFTTGWDSPLGMGFFKGLPSMQSKYKTQFYDQLTAMNEVFNLQRLYESRGEYNKALKIAEKNKNVLQWRKSYVKVNTKISQLNREIRKIQADKNLSESEKIDKVKQLNIIKNDMIQNLTEAVLSWEKSTGERVKRPLWWNR